MQFHIQGLISSIPNTARKYLNLLCAYNHKEKIWIVRKTSKYTHLKWQSEFSKFVQLKQHKMEFLRYDIYTKLLTIKIAGSLFGATTAYISGFATNWSQRPTSFEPVRNPTLFVRCSTMCFNRGNSLNIFKQKKIS